MKNKQEGKKLLTTKAAARSEKQGKNMQKQVVKRRENFFKIKAGVRSKKQGKK